MKDLRAWRGHPAVALLARWYLGWVFLAAAWHKIVDPASFALDIATYEMVPLWTINLMAITLPWIEVATGVLLFLGWRVRAACWLAGGMLVVFIIALGWALAQGLDTSCGCFASTAGGADPITWRTILRDVAWLAIALYVGIFDRAPWGIDWFRAHRSVHA